MNILSFLFGPDPYKPATTVVVPTHVDGATDVIRAILALMPEVGRMSLLKLTYLVQVVHVGRHGSRLFPETFKATAMGPYDRHLSQACRLAISRRESGRAYRSAPSLSPRATSVVNHVCDLFHGARDGVVTAATSMEGGAWWQLWRPSAETTMSISNPRRHTVHRTPSDQGPVIGFAQMVDDYRILTHSTKAAA